MLLFEKSISMGSSLRVSVSDRSNPEYTKKLDCFALPRE